MTPRSAEGVLCLALLSLLLAACGAAGQSPSPSGSAPKASGQPSATSIAVSVRSPVLIHRSDLGTGDLPGVSPPAPGGVPPFGPRSVATDGKFLYLWDQANRRILIYGPDRLEATLLTPGVDPGARSLMITAERVFLRTHTSDTGAPIMDYELDRRDGRVTRTARLLFGDAPLYPRASPQLRFQVGKDESESLGMDARGRRYERIARSSCQPACGHEIQRLDARGQPLLRVITPDYSLRWEDVSVSDDGRVLGLRWVYEGSQIVAVEVYELLPSAP